jgi:hypothetical protein
MTISDKRMDELIQRAKQAATIGVGGGNGSPYREVFNEEAYKATLTTLVDVELLAARAKSSTPATEP